MFLVTGASSGIGQATAIKLTDMGYHVILHARNKISLKQTIQMMEEKKANYTIVTYDITNFVEMKEAMLQLKKEVGVLDGLVNNAGIMQESLFSMTTENVLDNMYNVNVKAVYMQTQYAIKLMRKSTNASIVNISSIAGTNGIIGSTAYSASKAAIVGLTKSLSKELASSSIRVNAVAPGFIETNLISSYSEEEKTQILKNIGFKRLGDPREVANLIAFLLSPESQYITGQVIGIDGGMVI